MPPKKRTRTTKAVYGPRPARARVAVTRLPAGTYTKIVANPWLFANVRQPDDWRMVPTATHTFKHYQEVTTFENAGEAWEGQLVVHCSTAPLKFISSSATWTDVDTVATWTETNVDKYTDFASDANYCRTVGVSLKIFDTGAADTCSGMIYSYILSGGAARQTETDYLEHAQVSTSTPIAKGMEYYCTLFPTGAHAKLYNLDSTDCTAVPPCSPTGNGWCQGGFYITGAPKGRKFMIEAILHVEYFRLVTNQYDMVQRHQYGYKGHEFPRGEWSATRSRLLDAPNQAFIHECENETQHNTIVDKLVGVGRGIAGGVRLGKALWDALN